MVRPKHFKFDAETAESNAFQHETDMTSAESQAKALDEFEAAVAKFEGVGVKVKYNGPKVRKRLSQSKSWRGNLSSLHDTLSSHATFLGEGLQRQGRRRGDARLDLPQQLVLDARQRPGLHLPDALRGQEAGEEDGHHRLLHQAQKGRGEARLFTRRQGHHLFPPTNR